MRITSAVVLATIVTLASMTEAADLDHLRPAARWLATERLKGTLFHHTNIKPVDPLRLMPAQQGVAPNPVPVVLRGEHFVVIAPQPGRPVCFRLKTVAVRSPFENSSYAVFNAAGEGIGNGLVPPQEERRVTIEPRGDGPYVLLLNSGPAASTVSQLTVLDSPWGIDARKKQAYRDGPMHYHFLRDLKLGGFNLAMVDVEYASQEFLSDEGLHKWTAMVRGWADAARRYQLRMLYAIDLGGTKAEVESWGDSPKGLYIDDVNDKENLKPGLPLAPCPLQKIYWERILLRRGREVARMARENPFVVGIGIDPEMYACHRYGHYKPGGTCYCDYCLGRFLVKQGLPESTLKELPTAEHRRQWLAKKKLLPAYDAYLEEEMCQVAAWCRDELHRVNPDLLVCVYVLEIGNWFCRGLARGLGSPDLPVINFAEHTYYGVGYDRPWLDKTLGRFKDIGANFFEGSALWDFYFPPTKSGYLAAHAYNLAVRAEGWWYWPGDRLYDDWTRRMFVYDGQPARKADSWHAAVLANAEIDATMRQPGRASPLDAAENVAWKGKYHEREGGWAPGCGVTPHEEPNTRLHVAQPARLYFAVSKRARPIEVTCFAPGPDNGAEVVLVDPSGRPAAQAQIEPDRAATLIVPASEGAWSLEAKARPGVSLRNLGLSIQPEAFVATTKDSLLVIPTKQPGLVAYWPMDEGRGEAVADTSQRVAYNGVLRGGRWTAGVKGGALAFDGRDGGVSVTGAESLHGLTQFTLSAWVRLDALPERGNGATLIDKGPEAPVEHFWWWIGYPPEHRLTLELGNAKHAYGRSASSPALKWELGHWYHVAVVFQNDGAKSTVTHYRDGQSVAKHRLEEPFHSGDHDLRLGDYGGRHCLNGALDEVKIWDRALSDEEIGKEAGR